MDASTSSDRKLSNSVNAIVRVGSKNEGATFRKGEGFANELKCARSVGCEDNGVTRGRPEERKDRFAGFRSVCSRESRSAYNQPDISILPDFLRSINSLEIRCICMIAVTAME